MKKQNNSYEPEFKLGLTEEEINSPEFNPDDFAPAPDSTADTNENEAIENKRNSLVFSVVVALFALIICFFGWATGAANEKAAEKALEEKLLSCLPNCDKVVAYEHEKTEDDVYALFFRNKIAGYCVHTSVKGYGGDIEMLVAFNSDNKVCNIVILDHNESYGLGNKITSKDFLSQFNGLLIGSSDADYDLITGATVSSQAVADKVQEIVSIGISTAAIAKDLGFETITIEEIEEEIEKEEADKNDAASDNDTAETTGRPKPNRPGDHQGGANVNDGSDDDMNIDGTDVTTVYDTEYEDAEDTTEADTTEEPDETTVDTEADTTVEDTTADTEETTDDSETTSTDTTTVDTTTDVDTTTESASSGDTPTDPPEGSGPEAPVDNSQADLNLEV